MKKNHVYALLIVGLCIAWGGAIGAINWSYERKELKLSDFYTPSADAVKACMQGSELYGVAGGALSEPHCIGKMMKVCEEDNSYQLALYSEMEPLKCFNATYALDRAKREAEWDARDLGNNVSVYFGIALMILVVLAFRHAYDQDAPARAARRAEREAQRPTGSAQGSTVHTAAKVAGFAWGKAEQRLSAVKKSFDQGRAVSGVKPENPPDS